MVFALALTGIVAGLGAAIDYSRLSGSRTALQSALDVAILNAGKQALDTGGTANRAAMIAEMKANLPTNLRSLADNLQITQTTDKLTARVSGTLDNQFGNFLGRPNSQIAAGASVPLGSVRLELALVLDTTGSMAAVGKMDALKSSANQLIDSLMATRPPGTEIAIGVVPFATQVRVDTSYAWQPWIHLRSGQAIPAENTNIFTWDGCIMDRDKPLNRSRALPNTSRDEERYPAQNCTFANVQRILPLTTDMNQVRARIASLIPDGNTNTTIGMAWGYNILNPSAPMGSGAAPASRKPIRTMVFLTDGLNTADRFGSTPAQMDTDMRDLCREGKAVDVRVFTVRVIDGNDALLRDCASDPTDFYTTNDSAGLNAVFRSIAGKLARLKLSS